MNQVQTPDGMLTVAEFLATYKIASTKFYAEVADGRLKAGQSAGGELMSAGRPPRNGPTPCRTSTKSRPSMAHAT